MSITQLAPQPVLTFDHREERVVFLGTPAIAVPALRALAATPLRPLAVITEPDRPVGRHQTLTAPAVKQAATELGIAVAQPATAEDLAAVVQSLAPTVGVVVAYGRILRAELLAVPLHGFVNLHFSLLPRYRGATPIQAAILSGDTQTGVTLMQIDAGLDTGPILASISETIDPRDTAGSLSNRLAKRASTLAVDQLPAYLTGNLKPSVQPATDEPVTHRLTKDDGRIDWSRPVAQIERFIRAMDPWPRAWTELAGERIIIHVAHLDGEQLILDRLQVAGRRVISGSEFSRGYPAALTLFRQQCPSVTVAP